MSERPVVSSSERPYRGKLVSVRVDTLRDAGGQTLKREVVEHPGAVGIVVLDEAGRVLLVRQYRHPLGRETLEIPAGTLEPGEPLETCARRELREETGFTARDWRHLVRLAPSGGYCTEWIDLYLASELTAGETATDADEAIESVWQPLSEAVAGVLRGEIFDGKTMVGLLAAARERGD